MSWKNSAVIGKAGVPVSNTYAASGAIALTDDVALLDGSGGALAMTLADGYEGQRMLLVDSGTGNNVVVTPANFTSGTTATLNAANELIDVVFVNGGWVVVENVGTVVVA